MFLKGIATSSGIAIGKVYKLEQPTIVISEEKRDTDAELKVFESMLKSDLSAN